MKSFSSIILAIVGVLLGIVAYLAVDHYALPDPAIETSDQLYGGKTKEQIAAEFFANLDEEEGRLETTWYTDAKNFFAFALPAGSQASQQDSGGASRILVTNPSDASLAAEVWFSTAEDVLYENMIQETMRPFVSADACSEATGEVTQACLYEYLDAHSCDPVDVDGVPHECYKTDEGDQYYFSQSIENIYFIHVPVVLTETTNTFLDSFKRFPDPSIVVEAITIE